MFFEDWILGPQLTGAVMLLSAFIQKRFSAQGDQRSLWLPVAPLKTNQQTWDEGNRYSADLLIKYSLITIIAGVVLSAAFPQFHVTEDAFFKTMCALTVVSAIGAIVVMIRFTERHLKQTFPYTQ